jgi:SpoVK/Ycf46/Vps4 family AAA+-type ATPase
MVDMMTYCKMFPDYNRILLQREDGEVDAFDEMPHFISNNEELTTNQLLLLPKTTYGYSLREKKWISIYIEQMSEVVWNKKAFDLLVLEEETKILLRALIDVRMSKAKTFDDIVAGKGNGLVMLLHGSPGTGKSLTAESVAEFAGKPLYRVTCGDIGTEPVEVEQYLNTIFYLGKTWDCVLLLDEADVFLEERSVNDLQRNSLVSIFLRGLELYEGIIILTSNRVGTFDEAFQSRIRFALRYEPLGKRSRRAIWNNLFNMLLDDDNEINVNIPNLDRRLDELALYEVNGRQIRNALLTARQLALHRQESLEWSHLMQVLKLSDKFNKYLKEVKGHSDEDWAKSQALR